MSQLTISGAVSGLDTASMINSLVRVQQNQQTVLRGQQTGVQRRADAYTALNSALTALGTQATDLAKTSSWAGSTTTSSSTNVTATATGPASGSITFDVTAVAASHTLVTTSSLASTGDQAASGPLTVTKNDGTTTTVDVGGGSLGEVVSAINGSSAGITATAVRTGPGAYKLQLTADTTGAASSFTIDGLDGFDGTDVLTAGADATIRIGKNPLTAYEVTSSTNTFSDLIPGVTFTVGTEENGVKVSAKVDGGAVADKVNALVSSAKDILSSISSQAVYDSANKKAGPFTGESTVRTLQQNILSIVSEQGAPGVSVTRDGSLKFDRTAFLKAFTADPAKVASAFGAASTFTPADGLTETSAKVSSALKTTRAGTYELQVDSLPAREQWSVDTGGTVSGSTLSITRGTTSLSYTATDTDDLASTAAALNSRLSAANFGVTASVQDNALVFTADNFGTSAAFTASIDGTDGTQDTAGADISGSIDGQTAAGHGDVLSLSSGTGGAVGLSVTVSSPQSDLTANGGGIGSIAYTPGIAQRLVTLVNDATGSSGTVTTAQDGADTLVKNYQKQIDAWDERLNAYRQQLTTQFTAMETALARLKTQTTALNQLTSAQSSSSSSSSGSGG